MIWVRTEALGTPALLLLAQQCAGWDYFLEDVQAGFLAVDALVQLAFFCFFSVEYSVAIFQLIHFLPGILSFVRTEGWHNRHPQRQRNQEV